MPRYFFHTAIGDDVVTDRDGTDLRDADQAWEAARATVAAALAEAQDQARLMAAVLVVTDDAGDIVLEFPFAEAVVPPVSPGGTLH